MKSLIFAAAITVAVSSQLSCAQIFGSGIVFDPTQSGHAIQQIAQGNQLFTTTVQTTRNVIAAYNLAQRMASLPRELYSSYSNLGRQEWIVLTRPANTYGNSVGWINAAATGFGASIANQASSVPVIGRMPRYSSLSTQGQQAIAAQGATVDLGDALNVHTEMATLQRINQALLIELRTQQETNQLLQGQALQLVIGQKVQQDNLKALFQTGNSYQQEFNYLTPQQTNAGIKWAFHY